MESSTRLQYQHFVPQFLLRNFAHRYKPKKPKDEGQNGKFKKGMHRNDLVVRNLDLLADPPAICEKPVKRILGLMNMYQDTSKPSEQQQDIEKLLSKLEARASEIFRKITKACEQKESGLWLMRGERDILRKFLFLLKYRSQGLHRRFYHDKPEDYNENDREEFREYMAKHGFKRPLDVWFHNIKAIVNMVMDPEGKWFDELRKTIYFGDAMMFWLHAEGSYLAICTPENLDDEFILTDNCYGIFEGPNCFLKDSNTDEIGGACFTPLHKFAPISPKLMIVLRSNLLPNPLEDEEESIKKMRAFHRFLCLDSVYPAKVTSMLADLPVKKAQNNYSEIRNGRIYSTRGPGQRSKDDKFLFKFFPIESGHTHKINALMLDNAAPCSSVVFESKDNFARTLEWYLTAPCNIGKIAMGPDANAREATLKKLETISRSLGSEKKARWIKLPAPTGDYEQLRLQTRKKNQFLQRMLDGDSKAPGEMKQWLAEVTTSRSHDDSRFDDSLFRFIDSLTQKMWTLRVKIDAWSKGKVDEATRQRNRNLLLDAYLRLAPRRIIFYVMFARMIMLEGVEEKRKTEKKDEVNDLPPEGVVFQLEEN
ncbi:hypothetical protein N0V88_002771 [Collariella sp. IMI 366227]|nr:hypothetical protein N0V88_002771 [Collariella sp. IMI 366227]